MSVATTVLLPKDHPTIWISRDRDPSGALDESCDLWIAKPQCLRVDIDQGSTWVPPDGEAFDQCYLGAYTLAAVREFARTQPDDDGQLIVVQGTKRKLADDDRLN